MKELDRWQSFWKNKTAAGHSRDSDDHYEAHAIELKLLFGEKPAERVLEIGCGDGVLYRHLGFDRAAEYKGIDFSAAMLDEFHKRHPQVVLEATTGHSYRDARKYDLIFCSQVMQYFDRAMLDEYFGNAAAMLAPGGRLVCASVPWRPLRRQFLMGKLTSRKRSAAWSVLNYARHFHRDRLGHWYDWSDFERIGGRHGFRANFYGSVFYPYRFHAVLRPEAP